jgi:hypothetical protein
VGSSFENTLSPKLADFKLLDMLLSLYVQIPELPCRRHFTVAKDLSDQVNFPVK